MAVAKRKSVQSQDIRFRHLWLATGIACVAGVCITSLTAQPLLDLPEPGDKLLHAFAYGALMFWFAQLYGERSARSRLALTLLLVGLTLETLQALDAGRNFQLFDLFANALGIAAGWLGAPPRLPNVLGWIEATYVRR